MGQRPHPGQWAYHVPRARDGKRASLRFMSQASAFSRNLSPKDSKSRKAITCTALRVLGRIRKRSSYDKGRDPNKTDAVVLRAYRVIDPIGLNTAGISDNQCVVLDMSHLNRIISFSVKDQKNHVLPPCTECVQFHQLRKLASYNIFLQCEARYRVKISQGVTSKHSRFRFTSSYIFPMYGTMHIYKGLDYGPS